MKWLDFIIGFVTAVVIVVAFGLRWLGWYEEQWDKIFKKKEQK